MKRFHILLWKDFFTLNTLAHLVFKIVSRNTVCRHVHNVVIWPLTFCVSRCVQRAVTQVPHWAASSKTVPTSTTTGVLWSQVSAALCPPSPHITGEQSAPTYPYACLQVQCAQLTDFFFFSLKLHCVAFLFLPNCNSNTSLFCCHVYIDRCYCMALK